MCQKYPQLAISSSAITIFVSLYCRRDRDPYDRYAARDRDAYDREPYGRRDPYDRDPYAPDPYDRDEYAPPPRSRDIYSRLDSHELDRRPPPPR